MNRDKHSLMFPFSTTSARGNYGGRRDSSASSSSLIKWVKIGLIILSACRGFFDGSVRPLLSLEEENEMLKKEAENLKKRLALIENRIAELAKEPAFKAIGRDGSKKSNKPANDNIEKIDEVIQS